MEGPNGTIEAKELTSSDFADLLVLSSFYTGPRLLTEMLT